MKTSAFAWTACFALALSLGGCFGGNDGDDDTAGPGGRSNLDKLSPGLYLGDYSPYASVSQLDGDLESEFLINADGSYRFFWFFNNTPVVESRGSWFQRDSNLHFNGSTEAYLDGSIFYPGLPIEDDTNTVREVTATSFIRKEWTPLRQKPLWITYRKQDANPLGDGSFRYSEDFVVDSATTITYQVDIRLEDGGEYAESFLQKFKGGDTLRAYLADAAWQQIGSVLIVENYTGRFFDTTTHAYSTERDTLPGALLQRIKDVSDSGFKLWTGTWDEYRKE